MTLALTSASAANRTDPMQDCVQAFSALSLDSSKVDCEILPISSVLQQLAASYLSWEEIVHLLKQAGEQTKPLPAFLQRYLTLNQERVTEITFKAHMFTDHSQLMQLMQIAKRVFPNLVRQIVVMPTPNFAKGGIHCFFENMVITGNKGKLPELLGNSKLYPFTRTYSACRVGRAMLADVIIASKSDKNWPATHKLIRSKIHHGTRELQELVHQAVIRLFVVLTQLPAHRCSESPSIDTINAYHIQIAAFQSRFYLPEE